VCKLLCNFNWFFISAYGDTTSIFRRISSMIALTASMYAVPLRTKLIFQLRPISSRSCQWASPTTGCVPSSITSGISFTLACTASVISWIVKTGFVTEISRKLLSMMPQEMGHFKKLSQPMRLGLTKSPSERLS
jgi:hypothetical protein